MGKAGNSWARRKIRGQGGKFVGKVWGPPCPRIFRLAHEFSALPTNFRLAHTNFPSCPRISRPCPRIFRPCPRIFRLAHEFSALPTNFPNFPPCPRIFRLAHEFSALPTNFPPCPRISPPCPRIFHLAHEFSALPTNSPCPQIFGPCPGISDLKCLGRSGVPEISERIARPSQNLRGPPLPPTLPTNFRPSQGLRGQGLGSRVGWGYARQMGWVCGGGGRAESRWLFLAHVWP